MNNLALSLSDQGKHAEAEQMQRELLDVERRVLGPEHPRTLATMNNYALSLGAQGKHAEAEQMQRELLDLHRRVLGPEHPHTLTTMNNLARTMNRQGKRAEAEPIFRELLDLRRRVLGPEHPHTLATLRDLTIWDSTRSKLWSWTCIVSTSIWQFLARTLTTSRAVGSEDGVQTRELRSISAPRDPHPDAPPAKRARR
jgi:tetratricopeptide (TPR) repeat protein